MPTAMTYSRAEVFLKYKFSKPAESESPSALLCPVITDDEILTIKGCRSGNVAAAARQRKTGE